VAGIHFHGSLSHRSLSRCITHPVVLLLVDGHAIRKRDREKARAAFSDLNTDFSPVKTLGINRRTIPLLIRAGSALQNSGFAADLQGICRDLQGIFRKKILTPAISRRWRSRKSGAGNFREPAIAAASLQDFLA
jgi:hypothetical protein